MGEELLKLAKAIDNNVTHCHQRWLKHSQYETLEQFNTRHKHWMQTPLPSVGSRGKFPKVVRTMEELELGNKRMQQWDESKKLMNQLGELANGANR